MFEIVEIRVVQLFGNSNQPRFYSTRTTDILLYFVIVYC